jgi:serine O-acetyltransferase
MNAVPTLPRATDSPSELRLAGIVSALSRAALSEPGEERPIRALPSREALAGVVADLRASFFPLHFGARGLTEEGLSYFIGRTLDSALTQLREQVFLGLAFEEDARRSPSASLAEQTSRVLLHFGAQLPEVRRLLGTDVRAAFDGDPAARSPDEAIFCYPGITAMLHHRLAHELFLLGVPLIPRIISELAHATTGIDIHPGAEIGESFFVDHGTGVVVGETAVIGARVRLYQGVTLGARSLPKDEYGRIKRVPRHPIVEDDVVIYAGATILGRIRVGRGSTIGGNLWVTDDVEPGARVTQALTRRHSFDGGDGI